MTNKQESKLKMQLSVSKFLDEGSEHVSKLPQFIEYFDELKKGITLIQGLSVEDELGNKGVTLKKSQHREALIIQALDAGNKLAAFANQNNNQMLLKEIQYTKSDMDRASDIQLLGIARGIYKRAKTNIKDLASFDYTDAMLKELNDNIDKFNSAIPQLKVSTVEKQKNNNLIVKTFKNNGSILKNLDFLVETLRFSKSDFHSNYKALRKIVENTGRKITAKGQINDEADGTPIKGASISFVLKDPGASAKRLSPSEIESANVTKRSAKKGGFNLKSLPDGIYQVTVSKTGYETKVVDMVINNGERNVLIVGLKRL